MSYETFSIRERERFIRPRGNIPRASWEATLEELQNNTANFKIDPENLRGVEDHPKNSIKGLKSRMRLEQSAYYWDMSYFSSDIDKRFYEPFSAKGGVFTGGMFIMRLFEIDAIRRQAEGIQEPGVVKQEDIILYESMVGGLNFEELWEAATHAQQNMEEYTGRLFGWLGKPNTLENRMGLVRGYGILNLMEQDPRQDRMAGLN